GVLVYTAQDGILSMATDGDYLYFGTGGDAVGYGAEYTGDATVYRYDGSNVVPISDPDEMGEGVQVLYVSTRPPPQPAPTPPPTPPPSEWTEIVSDPIEGVRTNNIINPENFMGITFLDVDQDPLTGIPILLADVPITGVEYLVIVPPQELPEGQNWGYGAIAYITPYGELQLVAIIVIHFGETSYWYSIPLALLWDEGYMNVIQLTLSTEVPAGRSSLDAVKATFDTWPSLDAVEAFFRSPCTPFLADIAPDIPMGTTQLTEEWTEIIDDPEEGPIPDIVGVYSMLETDGNKIALSVKFSTLFYGTARIYLDTDQNRATGFHLLGAEYMVKTDPESANLYAWVEESEEFELVDSYSISYEGGDSCAFAIPLVDLADDGIMNVFVVAYGEVGSTDTAPNLAFGSTSPLISWEEMVTDPDDNVVPDVVAIDCSLTENMLSFRIRFDGPYYYPENGFVGITALDTDRNPNTGVRVGDIGADYAVVMVVGRSERIKAYDQWLPKTKIPIRSGRAMLNRWSSTTQSWQPVAELPALIGLGRYTIGIPLLLLGDDGILTFIQYVGDATMITDVVPDVGHASSTPVIDVAITNLIVEPPTPTIGETAEIVATVENQGIRSIVAVIDFAVDATTIGSVAIPLGARESAPVQVAWTPPSIGTYSITATARPLPGEEDLTDNSLTITLTLVADLAVTNIWIEPEPVLGFTSIIYVEVENQGNSIEYATVTFYDGTATALGEEIGSVTSETPLQPGETAELSIEWVPEIMGDRVIRAVLEPVLGETDVADNTFATTVTVLGVHDVAVTELTVTPTNPIVNRYCTIRVGIQNQGSYSESNVVVTVTVLSETTQVFTWSTTVRTLASGASRTLTTRWRPTATGRYMIRASITPVPDEIDTTDNVMERPVTVVPRGIKIDLNATPERVSIRSLTPVVITIQLKDKNGNILRLQGVVIELKTSRGTLSTTSVITDENGCATVLLTPDGRRGTVIVTASIRGIATSRIRIRFY
ncbi:MAG: CARDB domain-containing protein, partial [Candidatus Bathyarchaeia archaeon]